VSPASLRDYLQLTLAERAHEVFAVMFMDAQNRVIATEEMFRVTLTRTSVYPREVVIAALGPNAAAMILCHNHPSGAALPSRADEALTQSLKSALALVGSVAGGGTYEAGKRHPHGVHPPRQQGVLEAPSKSPW